MARRPNVQSDRDNWGAVLNDYLDVSLAEDGTLREAAAAPAIAAGTTEAYAALDIWDGFDRTGATAGSWDATTYAGWIAGIDNLLAGQLSSGAVVKTDLGTASDEATHLYSYAAGNGPVGVLIVSGQHGGETLGMWAAMRWFEQFVTSNETQMRQLRNTFRVTWVPAANPSQYRANRLNSNGVDINRNYDILWSRYTETQTTVKGEEPEGEPEAAIIAALIRSGNFRHTFDCHNYDPAGNTVEYGLPGHYLLGPRQFVLDSAATWEAVYADGATWGLQSPGSTNPTLNNYCNYYLRHVEGKADSTAMTLEASSDLFDSTGEFRTRAAVRAYAGMIQTHLLRVMHNAGRATASPFAYAKYFRLRTGLSAETAVEAGGRLVDSSGGGQVLLTSREPNGVNLNASNADATVANFSLPILSAPSTITVEVLGMLLTDGAAAGRHEVRCNLFTDTNDAITQGQTYSDLQTLYGSGPAQLDWRQQVYIPAGTGGVNGPINLAAATTVTTLSNAVVPSFSVGVRRVVGSPATIDSLNVLARVTPHAESHYVPRQGLA